MKRAPLVIVGTALGLAGVLQFHTAPASLSLAGLTASAGSTSSAATTSPPAPTTPSTTTPNTTTPSLPPRRRRGDGGATATTSPTTPTTTRPSAPTTTRPPAPTTTRPPAPTTTTTVSTGSRTATGPLLDYHFGLLSVSVKVTGSKITSVTIGSLNDGGNYRSQSIDSMAIPILEQEAMAAQSGNIQSVSGASYTSAGFIQSLQGALTTLGL